MDAQSVEISRLNAEVGRLTQAIQLSLQDFDKLNGGAALVRLREAVAPRPFVHVLTLPATAKHLQTRCGIRTFSESDVLASSLGQAREVVLGEKHQPCDACMKERA